MRNSLSFILLIGAFWLNTQHTSAQDYSLIASDYFPDKGDTISYQLMQGRGMDSSIVKPEGVESLTFGTYFQGGKQVDQPFRLDSAFQTFASIEGNEGLSLLMTEFAGGTVTHDQLIVEDFAQTENLTDLLPVIDTSGFTTSYNASSYFSNKALVSAGKPSGKVFKNTLGKYLEVVLLQNPYKMQYGDDMTARILLDGKPLKGASAIVYTKSLTGQIYSARYRSDDDGRIFFKINRSGLWLVQAVYANPSEQEGVDYNYFQSSYSFSFR